MEKLLEMLANMKSAGGVAHTIMTNGPELISAAEAAVEDIQKLWGLVQSHHDDIAALKAGQAQSQEPKPNDG